METKKFWKVIFFAVLTVCLLHTMVQGDDIKTGPRPGEKDPFNPTRPLLFRDDELLLFAGYTDDHKIKYHYLTPQKDDLTEWPDQATEHQFLDSEFSSTSRFRHMAAASGRIVNPDKRDTAVYAFFRPDGKVQVELWDSQSGRMNRNITLDGTQAPYTDRSVDVAVGDLDMVVDDNGMSHDEIVVVRTYDIGKDVAIDVLDYNLNIIGSARFSWPDGTCMVAAGIGDFNGDGYPEVAVGMASDIKILRQVNIYNFARDGKGKLISPLQFKKISENPFSSYDPIYYRCPTGTCVNRSFDMTVGDFNGDGKDEIFMASSFNTSLTDSRSFLSLYILQSDENLKLNLVWPYMGGLPMGEFVSDGVTVPDGQLRAQSGLFKFNQNEGWGLNRSQIALCYVEESRDFGPVAIGTTTIKCPILEVEGKDLTKGWWDVKYPIIKLDATAVTRYVSIDISTGNFIGHGRDGKTTSPLMDLAISYAEAKYARITETSTKKHGMKIVRDPLNNPAVTYTWEGEPLNWDFMNRDLRLPTAITAIDGDGDTWLLGPPLHITVDNNISLDYVVQEPPKHVDYLPTNPGESKQNWKWDVINVSAFKDFNVEFMDSQSVSFSTTSKDTSNWSIGGSAELDVKFTEKLGYGDIVKVSFSQESKTKIAYNYEESKSSYNSQYADRTTSFTSKTETDDFIAGKIQLMDIWRYPIVGCKTDDTKNYGFWEIILPGPKYAFKTGGLDNSDWYQPAHQNHNLLSYPSIRTQPFPPDLGSFTLPDGKVVKETMNSMDVHSFSGTSQTIAVSWTKEAGSGSEKEYNHTLSESQDIKLGMKAEAEFGKKAGGGAEASFSVSFSNENSWGGSKTEEAKNSESKGITINVPSGDSNKAYTFKSAVYASSGGGQLKVAHVVDPLGSTAGESWWRLQYGNAPDPGLNLPNRFISQQDGWELNEDNSRMEMRGFFLRKSNPNPVSGKYDLLDGSPTDGDTVNLCARVYNFALFDPTGFFDVLFESINIEQGGHEVGSRVSIGTIRTSLDALETPGGQSMKEVCVPWNTTGLSNAQYPFRFYVTVDPDDKVKNEIHEWKDANGNKLTHGNNEGYWPWGQGIPVRKKQSQNGQPINPSASMDSESLAIETPSGLKSKGPVRVFANEKYRLRAHIVANEDHPHYHQILFLDGPPENGKVIALKTNFGLIDGDNYIWTNWTPQEVGEREIYVHFIKDLRDEDKGDAWDSLKVIVRKEPISWRDELIDRLMGVEE